MIRRQLVAVAFTLVLTVPSATAQAQCGLASWYRANGSPTASGEVHHGDKLTAAHRTLPFGTMVRVRHQKSGKEVTVRINDRGPFIKKRIIDLSRSARKALGMGGIAPVCITVMNDTPDQPGEKSAPNGWEAKTVELHEASQPEMAPIHIASYERQAVK
jgi:rare lipoprotein A